MRAAESRDAAFLRSLGTLRDRIDVVDHALMGLLAERAAIVELIVV